MTHSDSPSAASTGWPMTSSEGKRTGKRGRPTGDREAKRAELLKAAIAVTAREGYAGASMRKVAKHAGCTTGAVTYYFDNKQEMDAAVAESLFDRFDSLLATNRNRIDVRGLIQQWLNWTLVDETNLWLALTQLLAHARHEPAFADLVQRRYAHFRQSLTSLLEEGQNHGVVRSDIPAELLADQLSAMGDGWMMLMPIEPERFSPGRGQELMDAVITLLKAPTVPGTMK